VPANPVFRIVLKKGEAFVRPASDVSEGGAARQVTFKNKTDDKVVVHLPGGLFVGHASAFSIVLDESAGANPAETLNVVNNAKHGLYSFKAYCAQTQAFAQGNSDPEFIIDN
jgi:hypothetical protein